VIGPDARQQRFAAEDDAGMRGEHEQQAEFLRGEIDVLAVDAHAPPRRIDVQSVNLERALTGSGGFRFRLKLRSPRPSQQRAGTRNELANAERLGEIVIRAALEPEHLVAFFAPRRQHQDRHILVRSFAPDRATNRNAIDTRQHQIEDDQIERIGVRAHERVLAVTDSFDLQAFEAEVELDQLADMRFVFDDENS